MPASAKQPSAASPVGVQKVELGNYLQGATSYPQEGKNNQVFQFLYTGIARIGSAAPYF
jgi:hypothetical protein